MYLAIVGSRYTAIGDRSLLSSFALVSALVKHRLFPRLATAGHRVVTASDAAMEEGSIGSAGFLVEWLGHNPPKRHAFQVEVVPGIYKYLSSGSHKIAQLEMLMLCVGLIRLADLLRDCRGVWRIDNVCALMALIKGRG